MTLFIAIAWFLGIVGAPIVASNKHRDVGGWLVLGILFGIFAFIVVALLRPLDDVETIRQADAWTRSCPHCLSRIPEAASVCRYCQRDVQPINAGSQRVRPMVPTPISDEERRRLFH